MMDKINKKSVVEFDSTYIKLPAMFYSEVKPTKVKNPELIKFNDDLAKELGIDVRDKAEVFSGNIILEGSEPIAQAYAGHQFGHFVSSLGDGRACLLGEVISVNGHRKDIQLKGSGITNFSRGGDGKAPLGAVIREYIMSEAMHALRIPTTRSLSIVSTGEDVYREEVEPAGILCRVASSHIRIGTFEYFATEHKMIKRLCDYTINRHFPGSTYLEFFEQVLDRQAKLIANWMSVGFIHGVMNTDNTSICGETIDYGPCAFLDEYEKDKVFSSIDSYGRYSFENQKKVIIWNLSRLAICLISLVESTELNKSLQNFNTLFEKYWMELMQEKIGVDDQNLVYEFLELIEGVDYTLAFRYLGTDNFLSLFNEQEKVSRWLNKWNMHNVDVNKLQQINPAHIPRLHLVNKAIDVAYKGDYSYMERLIDVLKNPFTEQDDEFMLGPKEDERVDKTFCGT
jgi:serine/tyrosine/threonine adenylyltransferase